MCLWEFLRESNLHGANNQSEVQKHSFDYKCYQISYVVLFWNICFIYCSILHCYNTICFVFFFHYFPPLFPPIFWSCWKSSNTIKKNLTYYQENLQNKIFPFFKISLYNILYKTKLFCSKLRSVKREMLHKTSVSGGQFYFFTYYLVYLFVY